MRAFETTSLRDRLARSLFHTYPFLSGCGTIANSKFAKLLVPNADRALWGSVDGIPCLVPMNDLVGRAIYLVGDLDRKVSTVIKRAIQSSDVVVDAGANLGLVTLQMAALVGPNGRVHAFEPSPAVLPYLEATLARSPSLPITLHKIGLGAEDGVLDLHIPEGNAGRASLKAEAIPNRVRQAPVEIRPLAAVLRKERVEHVALLKIDVEGFEVEVLRGLLCTSSALIPKLVVFEDHSGPNSEAKRLLLEAGYRLFGLPRSALISLNLIAADTEGFGSCHDFVAVHATADAATESRLGLRDPGSNNQTGGND